RRARRLPAALLLLAGTCAGPAAAAPQPAQAAPQQAQPPAPTAKPQPQQAQPAGQPAAAPSQPRGFARPEIPARVGSPGAAPGLHAFTGARIMPVSGPPIDDGVLALYDGDPLEYTTHCVGTIIDGVVVFEGSVRTRRGARGARRPIAAT